MTAGLPDGSTMDFSHVATLQLPGLTKKAIQIIIFTETITVPLISLGFPYVMMDAPSHYTNNKPHSKIMDNKYEKKPGTNKQEFGKIP